jgi:cell wall-associated NlpC family hydrolase
VTAVAAVIRKLWSARGGLLCGIRFGVEFGVNFCRRIGRERDRNFDGRFGSQFGALSVEAYVRDVVAPHAGSRSSWRAGRRSAIAAAALSIIVATLGATAPPASAAKKPEIPSQSQVDRANADAQAKAVQIGQTVASLAAANASLAKLNDQVEALVEAYNGAMANVDAAQQAAKTAQAQLVVARQARADAQVRMSVFAADSYRGAGNLDKLSALMASDTPQSFLTRAATLSALARHEQSVISTMTTTEHQQDAAQHAADQALADQNAAGDAATKAKDAAIAALNSQVGQVAKITQSQQDLQAQLAVLRGTAKDLASARAQGLKRLAEEAAAAKAAAAAAKVAAAKAAALAATKRAADQARQNSGNGTGNGSGAGSGDSAGGGGIVPPGGHSISTASQRQQAIAFVQAQLGVWYRWAGAGEVGPTVTATGVQNVPGFDCSGLTMRAYQSAGISLSHYTGAQWDIGIHVSRDQVQPGDLVFFATNTNDPSTIHHVGIYIGNGQMIDAPQTGEQVGVRNAFRSDYIGAVEP